MEEYNFKYNYVIVGAPGYYLVGYRDVINLPNVSYHATYNDGFDGWIKRNILRWNFSRRLNKYVKTPFSKYVYPRLYPHSFVEDKPLCFIFFSGMFYIYQSSYLEYVKKTYNAKTVLYFQDLLSCYKLVDINKAKDEFDLLISYDMSESKAHQMEWHPTPMSYVPIAPNNDIPYSDVYYCGYAKSRFPIIHDIYRKLTQQGYTCNFNLMYMSPNDPHIDGINYPDRFFSYEENLMHVCRSKCVLEIMQEGADGYTPRLWECIMYNKHLITNNKTIWNSVYFNPEGIHSVEDVENGKIENWINNQISFSEEEKRSLSPLHLLKFIDNRI